MTLKELIAAINKLNCGTSSLSAINCSRTIHFAPMLGGHFLSRQETKGWNTTVLNQTMQNV